MGAAHASPAISHLTGANAGNFHALYALFHSSFAAQRSALALTAPQDFNLLAQKSPTILQNIESTPASDMTAIRAAMDAFSVAPETRDVRCIDSAHRSPTAAHFQLIFATMAAVLHLGNIQFTEEAGKAGVNIANPQALRVAARLLKLPPATFTNALVAVRTTVRGEVIERGKAKAAAQLDLETLTQGQSPSTAHASRSC